MENCNFVSLLGEIVKNTAQGKTANFPKTKITGADQHLCNLPSKHSMRSSKSGSRPQTHKTSSTFLGLGGSKPTNLSMKACPCQFYQSWGMLTGFCGDLGNLHSSFMGAVSTIQSLQNRLWPSAPASILCFISSYVKVRTTFCQPFRDCWPRGFLYRFPQPKGFKVFTRWGLCNFMDLKSHNAFVHHQKFPMQSI